LLPVGVGQAAAARQQSSGSPSNRPVRVAGQGLLLVERQIGQIDLARLGGVDQRGGPIGAGQQRAKRLPPDLGREASQVFNERRADLGRFALADGCDQTSRQLNRRTGRDEFEQFVRRRGVGAA